jgi:hypothetical protein
MAAVHIDDSVLCKLPQPEMERHGGILEIPVDSLGSFEHDILNHVACINSPSHCLVEPHLDHAPYGIAVTIHQAIHCGTVAIRHLAEQVQSLFGFGPHGRGAFDGRRENACARRLPSSMGEVAAEPANNVSRRLQPHRSASLRKLLHPPAG